MEIRIDKEFESLIPPLSKDEFKQLEENILKEGIRDPLIVWAVPAGYKILLDGHNRYKIAKKHNIDFRIKEMKFNSLDDRKEAIAWICNNQLGRRNITMFTRVTLEDKKREALAAIAKNKRMSNLKQNVTEDKKSCPRETQTRQIKRENSTDYKIAKAAGTSEDTVRKVRRINEKASEKTKQLVNEGKLSINQAYNATFSKNPDPVKVAKEEHKQFQEQKAAAMVDFNDAQIDKINQRIINNAMVQDIIKLNNTIQKFALDHNTSDIHDLADEFTTEYRNELLKNLQKSTSVLEILANAIRR